MALQHKADPLRRGPADQRGGGPGRPGAAAMATDSESGTETLAEAEERRRSLFALKAMFDRGLIPAEEYERRKSELGG